MEANRSEELVILQADDLVGLLAHGSKRVRGRNRDRKNKLAGATHPRGAKGNAGGCASGNPVVDDDGNLAGDIDAGRSSRYRWRRRSISASSQDQVEGRLQRGRDLCGHRNAPAR